MLHEIGVAVTACCGESPTGNDDAEDSEVSPQMPLQNNSNADAVKTRPRSSGGVVSRAVLDSFEQNASMLEKCQRDLQNYANDKRKDFPRFYFLASNELLDLLAKGSEPIKALKHLPKILLETYHLHLVPHGSLGIRSATEDLDDDLLDEEQLAARKAKALVMADAVAFYGFGGEIVPFLGYGPAADTRSSTPTPLEMVGPIEQWMQVVLEAQEATLRRRLDQSVARYPSLTKLEWLMHTQSIQDYSVTRAGRPTWIWTST